MTIPYVSLGQMIACNAGVCWQASAHILIRRAPSWIKICKRRKEVLGSRGEAKKGVTGMGEGKEKLRLPAVIVCLRNAVHPRTESVIGAAWS